MHPLAHPDQHVIVITPPPVGGSIDAFVTHALTGRPPDEAPQDIGWVRAPDADQAVAAVLEFPWADTLWGEISAVPRRRDDIGHAILEPLTAEVAPQPRGRATHITFER